MRSLSRIRGSLLLGMFLLSISCLAGGPQPTSESKTASSTSPLGKGGEPPRSWTDPRTVAELAKSCRFDPDKFTEEKDRQLWGMPPRPQGPEDDMALTPFTCRAEFSQNCSPLGCMPGIERRCNGSCGDQCDTCATSCVASCETCKPRCQNNVCRQDCAKSCATCRQDCVRKRDRCMTGECPATERVECDKKKADWEKSDGPAKCAALADCNVRCNNDPAGPAVASCADCKKLRNDFDLTLTCEIMGKR